MKKRVFSIALALVMVLGLLPVTAFAAVTSENDWNIFEMDDPRLPTTQEQIIMAMIKDQRFAGHWADIVNASMPEKYGVDNDQNSKYYDFAKFSTATYQDPQYTDKGLRAAVNGIIGENLVKEQTGVLNQLSDTATPVYYVSTRSYTNYPHPDHQREGHGWGYYIQLFYDFEVEGIKSRFETPEVKDGVEVETLEEKGFRFSVGGSSDSYQVTAENPNDFANTVEKSYTYEKSTATSTTVSNSYSQNWSEETMVSVEFTVPILPALTPKAQIEQHFTYSYGMDKTYGTSKEESYSQSIQDTISVPLPAHTGIDINVNVTDSTTTIPYSGAVRITYKTKILAVNCSGRWYETQKRYTDYDHQRCLSYTFGVDGLTAIEDLDDRIENRNVSGYKSDIPMANLYQNAAFKNAADALLSGQPVAPYFGDFHYTSKNTVITPHQVYPLYALDRIVPDTEAISLYEQQETRLDGIKLQALDEFDVDWYGFNARLSGDWTVVDDNLDDASEYAEITTNRNGYPVLKALKPNDGQALYLRYRPNSSIDTTANFNSLLIDLTIHPVQLSSVTVEGSFDPFYLNDDSNTADVSGLTVSAKDAEGNDFNVSGNVKWYAEEADGITVDADTGAIEFTEPGTYQIYAVANDMESNRVQLQVLPERVLETLTVTGTIPNLIYDDDTAKEFDLSTLTVEAKDQYGEDMSLNDSEYVWKLASDKGYAEISGSTITGYVVGTDTVTLSYPVGVDAEGNPVYKTADPLTVKVTAKPYLNELYYNDGAPVAVEGEAYDLTQIPLIARDQHGDPFPVPADIEWALAANNQTPATINGDELIVTEGSVPEASNADVILEAVSPSTGKVAKNVVVKVEQKPVLKTIQVSMRDGFVLRINENAVLADQFTAVGYDQYGEMMSNNIFEWFTSKPEVVSLENGTLRALQEDSTEIYAKCGDVESNHVTLTVSAPRRLTSITADGVQTTARKGTTLDLSTIVVKAFDQLQQEFTPAELAAYPASVRWTLEKNDTNAVINGNVLSFGDQEGTMTLICAVVNADTNVIAERKISINITDSSTGGGSTGGSTGGGGGGSAATRFALTINYVYEDGTTAAPAHTERVDRGGSYSVTSPVVEGYAADQAVVSGTLTGDLTVTVTYRADSSINDPDVPLAGLPLPFADVADGAWYREAVAYAFVNDLMSGIGETTFAPGENTNRATIVTILHRLDEEPDAASEAGFSDILAGTWYKEAVDWGTSVGIISGYDDGRFGPNDFVTREQLVTILYRYAQMKGYDVSGKSDLSTFADSNSVSSYAVEAMSWAVSNGLISGTSDTTLSPSGTATRAEVAMIMMRFCENVLPTVV